MPVKTGIQVTDSVRHTVEEPYQVKEMGTDPGIHRGDVVGLDYKLIELCGCAALQAFEPGDEHEAEKSCFDVPTGFPNCCYLHHIISLCAAGARV
jgi:hypothetical protein